MRLQDTPLDDYKKQERGSPKLEVPMPNNIIYLTIGVPLILYLGQSIQYAVSQNRYGMALAFLAYALANVGFILDSKGI